MEKIKNILVPLDIKDVELPSTKSCMKLSKGLSDKLDSHIHIITVLEGKMLSGFNSFGGEQFVEDLRNKSKATLDKLIQDSGINGGSYTSELFSGEPYVEIVSKSVSIPPADLIIVGGWSAEGKHLLGDNAFKVVQTVPSHTLLLRNGFGKGNGNGNGKGIAFKKILVAMDFSNHALMALDYALLLKEILDKIEGSDFDLLTIGSHSKRRFFRNIFLGKNAYEVARKAPCSVLVIKAPPQ